MVTRAECRESQKEFRFFALLNVVLLHSHHYRPLHTNNRSVARRGTGGETVPQWTFVPPPQFVSPNGKSIENEISLSVNGGRGMAPGDFCLKQSQSTSTNERIFL